MNAPLLRARTAPGFDAEWLHARRDALHNAHVELVDASHRGRVDIHLVSTLNDDPMLALAAAWEALPGVPAVLVGDADADLLRSAREAGVAWVCPSDIGAVEFAAGLRVVPDAGGSAAAQRLRALSSSMAELSTSSLARDAARLHDRIIDEIRNILDADVVSLILAEKADDGADELRIAASIGVPTNVKVARDGIAASVARTGEGRVLLRAPRRNGFEQVEERPNVSSSIIVPIPGRDGAMGVLTAARRRRHSIFTSLDLQILVAIASIVGEALAVVESEKLAAGLRQRMVAVERLSTVGEIAGGIAHEVANPLAFVRSNVDELVRIFAMLSPFLSTIEGDAQMREVLDDLPTLLAETCEGIQRTEAIVKQMKSYLRVEGSGGAREEIVDFSEVVTSALRLVRGRVTVPTVVDVEGGLRVKGSWGELLQLFINLVVNASDAVEERRRAEQAAGREFRPEVRVTAKRTDTGVVVTVGDNGIGIPAGTLETIFQPLFTTKGQKGTGLGLGIVRRVVDAHSGRIRVESQPGVGTSFIITLPAHLAVAHEGVV